MMFRLFLFPFLLVGPQLSLSEQACFDRNGGRTTCPASPASDTVDGCIFVMAPSTLPNAGYGIYTLEDLSEGDTVGEPDLIVPILDKFKTIPYRSQQHMLSWLTYIWPAEPEYFYHASQDSYPEIPLAKYKMDRGLVDASSMRITLKNGEPASAFLPGMATMVNSDWDKINIDLPLHSKRGLVFEATQDIPAGSELFFYYGHDWFDQMEALEDSETEYDTLDDYIDYKLPNKVFPTEQERRLDYITNTGKYGIDTDDDDELDGNEEPIIVSSDRSVPTGESDDAGVFETDFVDTGYMYESTNYSEDDDEDDEDEDDDEPIVRSKEWIRQHGMCIDMLQPGPSTSPGAARHSNRGAYSKRSIPKGARIMPAPLLVIKRDDLVIYQADETQPAKRDVLNTSQVVGEEMLVNYCYGDQDSELLLVPYSPAVNFINHGSGEQANAMIAWPSDATWLDLHPIDALDMSGKIMMDFVALRDIEPGEEILVDFGGEWSEVWEKYKADNGNMNEFRKELGAPEGFFPAAWKNQSVVYEIAMKPLEPGELEEMRWKHNGKVVCTNCYRIGLPKGFSKRFLEYAENEGIINRFKILLDKNVLGDGEWFIFETTNNEEFFAQQYRAKAWDFNMHYISAWNEAARMSVLSAMGSGGFDVVLDSLGKAHGLDNMTCFHTSFMGVSKADNSFTHTDMYATDEKGFNIIWPLIVVNGSNPELDIVSDDTNVVVSVNYEYDTAFVMGDWGYHKTSPNSYVDKGAIRVVVGAYCGQIDDKTAKMMQHIYNGEYPAPFTDQFTTSREVHWGSGHSLPK